MFESQVTNFATINSFTPNQAKLVEQRQNYKLNFQVNYHFRCNHWCIIINNRNSLPVRLSNDCKVSSNLNLTNDLYWPQLKMNHYLVKIDVKGHKLIIILMGKENAKKNKISSKFWFHWNCNYQSHDQVTWVSFVNHLRRLTDCKLTINCNKQMVIKRMKSWIS